MAENQIGNMNMPIMGFSIQNKIMKERIDQMKNGVKKESVLKNSWAGVVGIALFASSLSVFAYSPKSIRYAENIAEKMYFSEDGEMWGNIYADLPVNENGGWIFRGEGTENIEILSELNPDIEMYSLCKHEYVSGETTEHF